jgi:hypothetical protein
MRDDQSPGFFRATLETEGGNEGNGK